MKIYLLEQDFVAGWDTYDNCVVIAENKKEAVQIHPSEYVKKIKNGQWYGIYAQKRDGDYETENNNYSSWVHVSDLSPKL